MITLRVPEFPLAGDEYFGPREGPRSSVSGFYRERRSLGKWQAQMKARGWHINTDGLYTTLTRHVVERFQEEKHLKIDGKIGPSTWYLAWVLPVT